MCLLFVWHVCVHSEPRSTDMATQWMQRKKLKSENGNQLWGLSRFYDLKASIFTHIGLIDGNGDEKRNNGYRWMPWSRRYGGINCLLHTSSSAPYYYTHDDFCFFFFTSSMGQVSYSLSLLLLLVFRLSCLSHSLLMPLFIYLLTCFFFLFFVFFALPHLYERK